MGTTLSYESGLPRPPNSTPPTSTKPRRLVDRLTALFSLRRSATSRLDPIRVAELTAEARQRRHAEAHDADKPHLPDY